MFENVAITQKSLLFESRIYFEDAIGNRDSIEIGYDTSANSVFNPILGESDLENVFNSEFEVRASHNLGWQKNPSECILSKKIIGKCEEAIDPLDGNHICFGSEAIIFFIKAKHQPVIISWDKQDFEDKIKRCNNNSFFTPDYNFQVLDPRAWVHWPNKRFACASKEDRFLVNMDPKYIDTTYSKEYTFSTKRLFSNGVMDTILGVEIFFELSAPFSPCQLISQTDNQQNRITDFENQIIYPNPAIDYMIINNSALNPVIAINIFNQNGYLLNSYTCLNLKENSYHISIDALAAGIYFIQLKYADYSYGFKKLLKIE